MSIKKNSLFFLLGSALISTAVAAPLPRMLPGQDFSFDENGSQGIGINNRILLKVNGTSISVLDVVKKMDLLFYRQYPQYAENPMARYQYYVASWRPVLQSVIDDQLILADAVEKKVEITDGDVREELEDIFGPDVVLNIDKMGLTYEDVWDLLKKEIQVRRMNAMMVRSKAMNEVSPKTIRELYEENLKKFPIDELWAYRILSIRGIEENKVASLAEKAHKAAIENRSLEEIATLLLEEKNEEIQINVSEEYQRKSKELSVAHKEILKELSEGNISQPLLQSGKNKEVIARLFLLKEHRNIAPPTFDEVKDQLQGELMQKAIVRNAQAYLEKLRTHYGITEEYVAQMIPETFQPFNIR